jgi:putative FmdB family regulatory protein
MTGILEDMPTYTYRCTKCGEEYEVVQSMSDPPLKRCKKCRGALRRTFHPVGIVLKGPGFHRTDYRTKPAAEDKGSEEKKTEKTEAKKESPKAESKSSGSDSKK